MLVRMGGVIVVLVRVVEHSRRVWQPRRSFGFMNTRLCNSCFYFGVPFVICYYFATTVRRENDKRKCKSEGSTRFAS